ncbi:DUF3631 domain-containing protein [Bradyrhizobium neotropicale]|uniref:DUF3631 domain-containing protein n=1 Tax=Bradyrhizobium neotropicale TaxID=1497615 RepID=UPI001374758F|nr:DUF3631 domain-containing protein [Bradyrhizobium neotropicale]
MARWLCRVSRKPRHGLTTGLESDFRILPRKHSGEGLALGRKLIDWAKSVSDQAKEIEPEMPDCLNDREQDKWEPLFIVGRLAGNGWEDKIRKAAIELSLVDKDIEPASFSELLLKDIYSVFNDDLEELRQIRTTELLEKLNSIDESPWSTFNYGRPLDGRGLARVLKPHQIKPKTIRFEGTPDKGYYKSDFEEAWERYLQLGVYQKSSVTTVTAVSSVTNHLW